MKKRTLTKDEVLSHYNEGYIRIICNCGKPLMLWANSTPGTQEMFHHVPPTPKCKQYNAVIKPHLKIKDLDMIDVIELLKAINEKIEPNNHKPHNIEYTNETVRFNLYPASGGTFQIPLDITGMGPRQVARKLSEIVENLHATSNVPTETL